MASSTIRSATRYTNNNTLHTSPSSSAEFSSSRDNARDPSRALTKKTSNPGTNVNINFSSMVKKLVETKRGTKSSDRQPKFVIANDFVVEDLKKNNGYKKSGGGTLSGLHKKLVKGLSGSGGKRGEEVSKKALTEVKGNTRSLGMVLRSERELLCANKEYEERIGVLEGLLEERNGEVEKLKDLCLKQREEIKSLKNTILFPDVMSTQLHDILARQGSELNQAKQLIPNLQKQVSSLTGQLQCLAEDLAEVKADKYSGRGPCDNHFSSPRTPSYDHDDLANSLFDQEFSSGDFTTPDSPDDLFLQDLNPCLTPYSKTKSRESDVYYSPGENRLSKTNLQASRENVFSTNISKSSDSCCQSSNAVRGFVRTARRSDESKLSYGKKMNHKLF